MANRVNRYQQMYAAMPRPNVAHSFPSHVFYRAQNHQANILDRIGNR